MAHLKSSFTWSAAYCNLLGKRPKQSYGNTTQNHSL